MSVKRETYIVVQGWMRTDLNLSGNELLLFALIYGFCQREQHQKFTGSLTYVMDWLNVSKKWAIKLLQTLTDKGLIRKYEGYRNNIKFCEYDIPDFLFSRGGEQSTPVVNFLTQGGELSSQKVVNKVHQGGEQSTPNNTIDNTINNSINIPIINEEKKQKFDPYFNNPIVDFYKTQYKEIIGFSPRVGTAQINKLIELYNDYDDLKDLIPQALKTAKKLKWDKCDPTNSFYILEKDNLMKLATGMYKVSEEASEEEIAAVRKKWLEDQKKVS